MHDRDFGRSLPCPQLMAQSDQPANAATALAPSPRLTSAVPGHPRAGATPVGVLACRYPTGVSDRWWRDRSRRSIWQFERVERCHDDYRNTDSPGNDRPAMKATLSQGVGPALGVSEAAVDLVAGGWSPLMVWRATRLGGVVHDAVRRLRPHCRTGRRWWAAFGTVLPLAMVIPSPIVKGRSLPRKMWGGIVTRCPVVETGRGALASKMSPIGTVPAHFPRTAALVHWDSVLQPAIASAGGRGPSGREQ